MFYIDPDEMAATLYSFEKLAPETNNSITTIRLENNLIASLHESFSVGVSTSHRFSGSVYSNKIIANVVVLGRTAWKPLDAVRSARFTIEHSEDLMHHTDKFSAIADAEMGKMPDSTLLDLSAKGVNVKVSYSASFISPFRRPTKIGISYSIEFQHSTEIKTYLSIVTCIVQFVSAAMGFKCVPSDINISSLNYVDFVAAVNDRSYIGDHEVYYIWPVKKPDQKVWVGNSFVHARNDVELVALVDVLRAWIMRDAQWRSATNMMMEVFRFDREISSQRLLNACKWLEEIPGATSNISVSADDIDRIASVAAAEAARLGHSGFKERIAGVIRGQLKTESNVERFQRLHAAVCSRFGEQTLPGDAIPCLLKAMKFRGRVAHGAFEPADEEENKAFVRSIYAMEALCYLLTIKDLPMSDAGATRVSGIEIVANYRNCYK
jgi:hypothetical protein